MNLPLLKYAAAISKHSKTANRLTIADKFVSETHLSVFKNIEKKTYFDSDYYKIEIIFFF